MAVSTNASDRLVRLVSEMTDNVLMGTLNLLTQSLSRTEFGNGIIVE